MNQVLLAATIRHILAAVGGILVARGWLTEDAAAEIIAGLATVAASLIWSYWQKKQATLPAPPPPSPPT